MPARRSGSILSIRAASTRQWIARVSGIVAFSLALTLFVMGRTSPVLTSHVRAATQDVLTPIISILSAPAQTIRSAATWVSDMTHLRSENIRLAAEVKMLSQAQVEMHQLRAENEALRALITTVPQGAKSYIAARIVGDSGGPYMRSALVNGGTRDGVAQGQAVIGTEGLVGRIIETGNQSARVLLLTDINFRVPVIGEQSRERSIASGTNKPLLNLDYVPAGSKLAVGERLLTSGDGGVFPAGIPVGVVTSIQGNNIVVQPFTDWARLEYVNIVDYNF